MMTTSLLLSHGVYPYPFQCLVSPPCRDPIPMKCQWIVPESALSVRVGSNHSTTMKLTSDELSRLASKIAETEAKLEHLAAEIAEIGQPAGAGLQRRLDALTVEERALKRNVDELLSSEESSDVRVGKIEALLKHIESEEASLEHEADFLHQAAPSSVIIIAEAGARLIDLVKRAVHRVMGDHHLLGSSVFVNHTHDELVEFHGLEEKKK